MLFFIPYIFLSIADMNLGFSISITFISYLLIQLKLTIISAAAATTNTHFGGNSDAASKPAPKNTADFTFCLRHLISSPYTIIHGFMFCVLEFFPDLL